MIDDLVKSGHSFSEAQDMPEHAGIYLPDGVDEIVEKDFYDYIMIGQKSEITAPLRFLYGKAIAPMLAVSLC